MSSLSPRSSSRRIGVLAATLVGLALGLVPGLGHGAAAPETPHRLLVVYRDSGPHALEGCAEDLFRRGRSLATASADRSDSLDQWQQRHRVQGVHALFRSPEGGSNEDRTGRMARRLAEASAARTPGARVAGASASLRAEAATLAHAYAVELPADGDLETALAELRADPHVAFAQRDHLYALDYAPDDPYLTSRGSWGRDYADLWGLDRIRALEAWQTTRGAGQIVAVVDTGLDYTHPDIAANVWINPGEDLDQDGVVGESDWNGLDDDANGWVDDLRGYDFAGSGEEGADGAAGSGGDPDPFDPIGHGTHVSGTIAAVGNNGIGIAGVAPEARIMALKGFSDTGSGRDSDLWTAVLYAIENGAGVVNASWSCSPACPDNPLARSVLAVAAEAGVVFVTSAGNEETDVVRNEPERTTAAITVGSLSEGDSLSIFSNRGWLVDLVAPGGGSTIGGQPTSERNILSLAARELPPLENFFRVGDAYYRLQGTSMAAPHVAGAVALLRATRPQLPVDAVRRLLRIAARDLPPEGHDALHGAGALDLVRLLSTPLPDLDLAFVAPDPGSMHDPASGPLAIVVRAGGGEAARFSLARARGLTGSEFETLEEWEDPGDGEHRLAWDVASIAPGPQVLRLRATLRDGRAVDEFTIVGLEGISPVRLSTGSFHEVHPDVSGRTVVWEALSDTVPRLGQIVTGGFDGRGEAVAPVALEKPDEGSFMSPRIDGRRVVWRAGLPGTPAESLLGCGRTGYGDRYDCRAETIASTPQRLDPYALGRGVVLWSDAESGREIAGCRWPHRGGCVVSGFGNPDPAYSSRLLDFDGRTLVWRSNDPAAPVGFCRMQTRGKGALDCAPSVVRSRSRLTLTDSAGIDEGRLAVELFDLGGSRLGHCALDLQTGTCELRFVLGVENPSRPAVSNRRIVWMESPEVEDSSIAYCEVDPIDGSCPRRRLTGAPSPARDPRIDGNRIVWEDDRFGPTQILGLELPGIDVIPQARVEPSGITSIPIRRVGTLDDASWRFALEGVRGLTPSELEASVVESPDRSIHLVVQARRAFAGRSGLWRIRATTPAGLETSTAIEVFVDRLESRKR